MVYLLFEIRNVVVLESILKFVEEIAALEIRFSYDSTIGFEITNVAAISRIQGFSSELILDASDPADVNVHVLVFVLGMTLGPGSGEILAFGYQTTFNKSGESALEFTEVLVSDIEANPLSVQTQDGKVVITSINAGGADDGSDPRMVAAQSPSQPPLVCWASVCLGF